MIALGESRISAASRREGGWGVSPVVVGLADPCKLHLITSGNQPRKHPRGGQHGEHQAIESGFFTRLFQVKPAHKEATENNSNCK